MSEKYDENMPNKVGVIGVSWEEMISAFKIENYSPPRARCSGKECGDKTIDSTRTSRFETLWEQFLR